MTRFFGVVGFGASQETSPGVWEDVITERSYYGDVNRISRTAREDQVVSVNSDLSISNTISIVADAYANQNYFAIRYVKWNGAYWTVPNITLQAPRLVLDVGVIYNGPRPDPAANAARKSNA